MTQDRGTLGAIMDALWPILGGDMTAAEVWHEINDAITTALAERDAELAAKNEELARMREALVNHNDVLRSAYQIAARKGEQTEWEGFTLRAGSVLHFHHEEVECARAALGDRT